MKKTVLLYFHMVLALISQAQDLRITGEDVYLEPRSDGYHLFVRDKLGLGSVMLTESFERDDHKVATYSLRALEYNPVNGDEQRILNGEFLETPLLSLIDSTPEYNERLAAQAFHILIPPKIQYGYPGGENRYGIQDISNLDPEGEGFWFSIRAFARPFGDYSGEYLDNAFEIQVKQVQTPEEEPLGSEYVEGIRESFEKISENTIRSDGGDDLVDTIEELILASPNGSLDVVLALDTTKSMEADLRALRERLLDPVKAAVAERPEFRIGLLFYRDYMEEYLTRTVPFSSDWQEVQIALNRAVAFGGGDKPEAVLEALYAGLTTFDWTSDSKLLLLIGDAPQHEVPRGRVTEDMVNSLALKEGVEVVAIMLPF